VDEQEVVEIVADAIDPADPDGEEKAGLVAEILLAVVGQSDAEEGLGDPADRRTREAGDMVAGHARTTRLARLRTPPRREVEPDLVRLRHLLAPTRRPMRDPAIDS
jgi:hypothetical protein